jgi:hypothetical protein
VTRAGGAASRDISAINLWGGSFDYKKGSGMVISYRGGDGCGGDSTVGETDREFEKAEFPVM